MTDLRPGYYWKTPFAWEPGQPAAKPQLAFEPCSGDWLLGAVELVMANSMDPSDESAVKSLGASRAAQELLSVDAGYFEVPEAWWRVALGQDGERVGFVLPVIFKSEKNWKVGRPEATIYYMGVLPAFRGRGFGGELLAEAIRICQQTNSWRLFCDTGTANLPMVRVFRKAGFTEHPPWQRSIA